MKERENENLETSRREAVVRKRIKEMEEKEKENDTVMKAMEETKGKRRQRGKQYRRRAFPENRKHERIKTVHEISELVEKE